MQISRKLVNYRNTILKQNSIEVADNEDLDSLLHDMDKVATAFHAYGISAVQVGELKRVFLFRENITENFIVAINPEILDISEIGTTVMEGCLSFPNVSIPIARPFSCKVVFEDQKRSKHELEFFGLRARVFLHETEHLNGKTVADNLSLMKREIIDKKIRKWQKKVDPTGLIYETNH